MENREMFDEINALVGAVAKALGTSEMDVVTAIEQGRLSMEMAVDEDGRHYVAVECDGKSARVYQGAIFRPDDRPEEDDAEQGGCGTGGCGCGH